MGVIKRKVPQGTRRCPVCALDAGSVDAARRFRNSHEMRLHLIHTHSCDGSVNVKTETTESKADWRNKQKRKPLTLLQCSGCSKTFANSSNLYRHAKGACKAKTVKKEKSDGEESATAKPKANPVLLAKDNKLRLEVAAKSPARARSPSPADTKQFIKDLVEDALWPAVVTPSPASSSEPIRQAVDQAIQSLMTPPPVGDSGVPAGTGSTDKVEVKDEEVLIEEEDTKDLVTAMTVGPISTSTPIDGVLRRVMTKDPVKALTGPSATSTPIDGVMKRVPVDNESSPFASREKTRKLKGFIPMSPSPASTSGTAPCRRPPWVECPQCCQRLNSSAGLWGHMKRVHSHRKNGPPAAPPGTC